MICDVAVGPIFTRSADCVCSSSSCKKGVECSAAFYFLFCYYQQYENPSKKESLSVLKLTLNFDSFTHGALAPGLAVLFLFIEEEVAFLTLTNCVLHRCAVAHFEAFFNCKV